MNETHTKTEQAQWQQDNLADPHAVADKAQRVQKMFAAIASSYDLNNRLHSMWRDQAWRRKAVKLCGVQSHEMVMDVACGTGDLSLAFANANPKQVIGIDFTHEMVAIAAQKAAQAHSPAPIHFADGDAMRLPVPDGSADVVSIAFGIRNVANPMAAMREFYRVLRPGGRLCILEFSVPRNPILHAGYMLYFKQIMPRTATLISRDRSGAYKYLPQSVNTFLSREKMMQMMQDAGFEGVTQTALTFGIAIAYIGRKQ